MVDLSTLLKSSAIFKTVFPNGNTVEWRLLTLKEYRIFSGLRSLETLSEEYIAFSVFKHCYQGSFDLLNKRMPAGIPITIGRLILYLSGDCEKETIKSDITIARAMYQGAAVNEHMKRVVFTAFPVYKIEDADSWTRQELLEKFAISEVLLIERGIVEKPFDVDSITFGGEQVQEDSIVPINFETDSQALTKELGPWAQSDIIEEEVNQKKRVLSKKQSAQLDKIRRG